MRNEVELSLLFEEGENVQEAGRSMEQNNEARLEQEPAAHCPENPARIVVFDFDRTCINGNSPVLLVRHMFARHMLSTSMALRLFWWGVRYALHLPLDEAHARQMVFSGFEGRPVAEVDQFLRDFYDQKIECLYRAQADQTMQAHLDAGDVVIVVSATFEPIILRAMEKHAFHEQISVRMRVDENGCYLRYVVGTPTEGKEKIAAVTRYGNEHFGEGNWVVSAAYADHYSDAPLLEFAERAYAVSPGPALRRVAKRNNWEILEWD